MTVRRARITRAARSGQHGSVWLTDTRASEPAPYQPSEIRPVHPRQSALPAGPRAPPTPARPLPFLAQLPRAAAVRGNESPPAPNSSHPRRSPPRARTDRSADVAIEHRGRARHDLRQNPIDPDSPRERGLISSIREGRVAGTRRATHSHAAGQHPRGTERGYARGGPGEAARSGRNSCRAGEKTQLNSHCAERRGSATPVVPAGATRSLPRRASQVPRTPLSRRARKSPQSPGLPLIKLSATPVRVARSHQPHQETRSRELALISSSRPPTARRTGSSGPGNRAHARNLQKEPNRTP